jgi:hypothetical protein
MIDLKSCYNALKIIDGVGELWSPSGQFLGQLSSIQDDPLSIINPDGIYGSQYSSISIRSNFGMYGGKSGIYSPYNPNSVNPPVILYQRQAILLVTKNTDVTTNGLPIVDPDLVLNFYVQHANTKPKSVAAYLQPYSSLLNNDPRELAYNVWGRGATVRQVATKRQDSDSHSTNTL